MTARPPQAVLMPPPAVPGDAVGVGTAYYRTDHELTFYLRAFRQVRDARWVVVVALRPGRVIPPDDHSPNTRLILTARAGAAAAAQSVGWFEPDPLRAVVLGMTGLRDDEGLMLLFPADWDGPSPDELVETARRWRAGPHSREDDAFFDATHPN